MECITATQGRDGKPPLKGRRGEAATQRREGSPPLQGDSGHKIFNYLDVVFVLDFFNICFFVCFFVFWFFRHHRKERERGKTSNQRRARASSRPKRRERSRHGMREGRQPPKGQAAATHRRGERGTDVLDFPWMDNRQGGPLQTLKLIGTLKPHSNLQS